MKIIKTIRYINATHFEQFDHRYINLLRMYTWKIKVNQTGEKYEETRIINNNNKVKKTTWNSLRWSMKHYNHLSILTFIFHLDMVSTSIYMVRLFEMYHTCILHSVDMLYLFSTLFKFIKRTNCNSK